MHRLLATLPPDAAASLTPDAETAATAPPSLRCRFAGGATAPATVGDGGRVVECARPDGARRGEAFDVVDDDGSILYSGRGDGPPPAKPARCGGACTGALLPYTVISLSYILFTTTDGAVRMIVLLHAYALGFSAMALAAAGVVVNLLAGMAGSRFGIKATLLAGLTCQLVALAMLAGWQKDWSMGAAVAYITVAQVLNGVAKDLTKLGGKTVTKLVSPGEKQTRLYSLVAWVTGFKNSAKGFGYLLGSALLTASYPAAIAVMAALILAAYPWAWLGLDWSLGRSATGKGVTLRSALTVNARVGWLSGARCLLFASRDLWFEVTLPYFLRDADGGVGWSRVAVGAFLAVWIIAYGQVQAHSGPLVLSPLRQLPPNAAAATLWAALLVPLPAAAAAALYLGGNGSLFGPLAPRGAAVATLTTILYSFCVVFAVNSAVHSFLVVRYADGDKVASTVGFYYMSNAGGRLVGTLLSGVLYTYAPGALPARFGACLAAAAVFAAASAVVASRIPDPDRRLACGPCVACGEGGEEEEEGVEGEAAAAAGDDGTATATTAPPEPVPAATR